MSRDHHQRSREPLPRAKRSLGQNFLVNAGVRDKIVAHLAPGPMDWVVELGPGPGALTSPLSARCGHLVAVELDESLASALAQRVERPDRLEVLRLDGAALDYAALAERAGGRLLVVGNLPFNAAAALLRQALAHAASVERAVLMFQKEVGLRLTASAGTRAYGLLTVVTAARARVTRLFDVAPGSFRPPPKVAASVLRFDPHRDGLPDCCLSQLDQLARQVFAHRRKTLRNGLRGAPWPTDMLEGLLEGEGIRLSQRAEELSPDTYGHLAAALCRLGGAHREGAFDG